ncbi:MAG: hypothetical protein AABX89_00540 [Candidatus Thermoplasmatota archaeon]
MSAAATLPSATPEVADKKRPASHWWRKLAALLLVLISVTSGMLGLGLTTSGNLWGIALMIVMPLGIYAASRVTPEAGTTGYFDRNI